MYIVQPRTVENNSDRSGKAPVILLKGTQDWDFFGFDFEICIISLLFMSKY